MGEQQAEARQVIAEQGWTLDEAHAIEDDGRSASRFASRKRERWPDVLRAIDRGEVDVLLLWESSRGDRKLARWAELLDLLRDRGVLLYIVSHERGYDVRVPRDWKAMANDGVDSAAESEVTSKQVRRGVAGVIADGKPIGRTPFGYRRRYWSTEDPETGKPVHHVAQEEHSEQGPVVREIFHRLARGVPVNKLTEDLNARGVPASTGGAWTRGAVRWVASNEAYIARRTHAGVQHEGAWPALVSEAEFRAVQRILTDRRTGSRPGSIVHLLSHLAECGQCHEPLGAHPGRPGRSRYYSCPRGHTAANADSMDYVVALDVVHQLAQPWLYGRVTATDDSAVVAAQQEAAVLRDRLAEHVNAAADGTLSAAMLAAMEAKLLPRIEAAEQRAVVAAVPVPLRELVAPGDNVDDIGRRWEAMSLPAQRTVLRYLIRSITLAPLGRRGRRGDATPAVVADRLGITWAMD